MITLDKESLKDHRSRANLLSIEFFSGGDPQLRNNLQHFNIWYPLVPNFTVPDDVNFDSDTEGGVIFEDWLEENYRHVTNVHAWDEQNAWVFMQGENWSPNGEARELIKGLGLRHTSMSVGDIMENTETGEWLIVDYAGFKKLGKRGWE